MVLRGCLVTWQGVKSGSQIEAVSKAELLRQEAKAEKAQKCVRSLRRGPGCSYAPSSTAERMPGSEATCGPLHENVMEGKI